MSSEIYLENNNNNNKLSTLLRELSGGIEPAAAGLSMTPPDVWDSERAMGMGSSSGSSGGGAGGLGMFSTRDAGPPQRV